MKERERRENGWIVEVAEGVGEGGGDGMKGGIRDEILPSVSSLGPIVIHIERKEGNKILVLDTQSENCVGIKIEQKREER